MTPRLATASSPKGDGTDHVGTKPVIIVPVMKDQQVAALWAFDSFDFSIYHPRRYMREVFSAITAKALNCDPKDLCLLEYNLSYSPTFSMGESGRVSL